MRYSVLDRSGRMGARPVDARRRQLRRHGHIREWRAVGRHVLHVSNILSLSEKNRGTGENLGGRYLASTDMILVDELTRPRIEEVVADLVADGSFNVFFRRVDARTYLGGMDALLEGLADDQATEQLGRLGAILSRLGYRTAIGRGAPLQRALGGAARRQRAGCTDGGRVRTAVPRMGPHHPWRSACGTPGYRERLVGIRRTVHPQWSSRSIGHAGATSTDWLLRIEEEMGVDFVDRVQEHFAPGSAVRRRMSDGRRRVQFKAQGAAAVFRRSGR